MDALQPGFYQQMQLDNGRIDVTIFSAWFAFLDIAVPLAVAYYACAWSFCDLTRDYTAQPDPARMVASFRLSALGA
jgi:hypothetical protein